MLCSNIESFQENSLVSRVHLKAITSVELNFCQNYFLQNLFLQIQGYLNRIWQKFKKYFAELFQMNDSCTFREFSFQNSKLFLPKFQSYFRFSDTVKVDLEFRMSFRNVRSINFNGDPYDYISLTRLYKIVLYRCYIILTKSAFDTDNFFFLLFASKAFFVLSFIQILGFQNLKFHDVIKCLTVK